MKKGPGPFFDKLSTKRAWPFFRSVGIIGLGLIGGSIWLAARQRHLAREVIGWSRSRRSVREALKRGAITRAARSPEQVARSADLVIIATPVGTIAPMAKRLLPRLKPGAVLTDVGSTKATVVAAIEKMVPGTIFYAGAHPLAGSEKSGVAFARADLFRGSVTVVTKTRRTPPAAVTQINAFWRRLGSRVIVMSPRQHDAILARTSHLPHLVAVALVQALHNSDRPLTASGFKDATRIAASSPALWRDILFANATPILQATARFEHVLVQLTRAIRTRDSVRMMRFLRQAQHLRASLEDPGKRGQAPFS